MAVTTQVNMNIPQGSTYVHTFTYVDSNSNPIDLSGYSARMQIRESIDDTTFVYEATTTTGEIVITGSSGIVELTIADTDTAAFTFTSAVYDLEIESVGGVVTRLVKGKIKVDPEVTR